MRSRSNPRAILAGSFALFVIYAFPGYLSNDQELSILQSRTGVYEDAHPPVLALLWRICEIFTTGPALMLVAQVAMFHAGIYLLAKRRLAPAHAAWVAAATLLFPPLAGVLAVAGGKEPLMFAFIVLGSALVMSERSWTRRTGLVLFVLGSAVRWNAMIATLFPLLALYAHPSTGWRRYAMAAGLWIAITLAAFGLNTVLTDRSLHHWYSTHAYEDIAGTIARADDLDDNVVRELLADTPLVDPHDLQARMRAIYNPAHYDQLREGPMRIWDLPRTEEQRSAIGRAWRATVLGHLGGYLRYRWDNVRILLSLQRDDDAFSNVYIWFRMPEEDRTNDPIAHEASASRIQRVLQDAQVAISRSPLTWVFPYVLVCFALVPFALRDRFARAWLASALVYEASWFVLAPTPDVRYSAWLWPCIALVVASLIARRRELRPASATKIDSSVISTSQ